MGSIPFYRTRTSEKYQIESTVVLKRKLASFFSIFSSVHFKILQLVRARNRPIRQLFVQFLVE